MITTMGLVASAAGVVGTALPAGASTAPDAVQAELVASDGAAGDGLGGSVAIDGDVAVVAARQDDDAGSNSGAAYVYRRTGIDWSEEAKLTAADAAAFDGFGSAVALDGDTVVVGAEGEDGVSTNTGAAYVFVRSGGVWSQQAKLTAADAANGDQFGGSVALDGDTIVVGSANDDDAGSFSGSAYVFTRSGGVWTQQAKLTASDASAFDEFGGSVALTGDTTVVGATGDDDGGGSSGSAYVFSRTGSVWTEQAKLTASDAFDFDVFGSSVAVDADTALIAAPGDDDGGTSTGSVYAFTRSGSVWTEQGKLVASDPVPLDVFGSSVALDGDLALIGARLDDDAGTDAGSAYVFTRSGGVWTEAGEVAAPTSAPGDNLGVAVDVSGGSALVGADLRDSNGADSGSAYVFVPDGTPPTVTLDVPADGATYFVADVVRADYGCADLETAFTCVGDLPDGSVIDTSTPGPQTFTVTSTDNAGSTTSVTNTFDVVAASPPDAEQARLTAFDPSFGARFGSTVAIDGDIAVVAADSDSTVDDDLGSLYVYARSGNAWIVQQKLTVDPANGPRFGEALAISGDTIVAGADQALVGGTRRGAVFVFVRNGSTWTEQARLTASDGDAQDFFGTSVTIDGDTIVVGAVGDRPAGTLSGSAYVFTRSDGVWTEQTKLVASDGTPNDQFGESVALEGDRLVVGAEFADGGGAAYAFTGGGSVWTQEAKLTAPGAAAGDRFGASVDLSGDTAVIGSLEADGGTTETGAADVFTVSGGVWTHQAELVASDGFTGDDFGASVAIAGDLALVGAPTTGFVAGSAYLFTRSGGTWSEHAELLPEGGGTLFGTGVALDGETAVIGAEGTPVAGLSSAGAAHVFIADLLPPSVAITTPADGAVFPQGGLVLADFACTDAETAVVSCIGDVVEGAAVDTSTPGPQTFTVTATDRGGNPTTVVHSYTVTPTAPPGAAEAEVGPADAAANQQFGTAVAADGDLAAVGAPLDDDQGTDAGAVYVYARVGSTWQEEAKLTGSDSGPADQFGGAVAVFGDTVVVGARLHDGAAAGTGAAYVFVRDGGAWSEQTKLVASDADAFDRFGGAVALSADTVVIGADQDDDGGTSSGSAYVFVRDGTTWTEQAKLVASDDTAGDRFGSAVALFGATAVVGAPNDDDGGSSSGAAYVFVRDGSTWTEEAKLTAGDAGAAAQLGAAVALSVDTAVIGAPGDAHAGAASGAAYAFVRTGSSWSEEQKLVAPAAAAGDRFGDAVAALGDTALVGAPRADGAAAGAGTVHVTTRAAGTWSSAWELTPDQAAAADRFGEAVSLAGETAVIGARLADRPALSSGVAHLFTTDTTAPSVELTTPGDGAVFTLGQPVTVDFACADVGSGIASCVGDEADGALLDTSALGTFGFTVTGTDRAGNTTTVTHSYTVDPAPPVPVLAPGVAIVTEGDAGSFTARVPVRLSGPSPTPVTADWTTFDTGAPGIATADVDYVAAAGTVTFAPGETEVFVDLTVFGDRTDEPPALLGEWAPLVFSNPTGATIDLSFFGVGLVVIVDDDETPIITPGFAFVDEGDAGTVALDVPVTLSNPSQNDILVDFATIDTGAVGIATPGVDYVAVSGTLTIPAGATSAAVALSVIGDEVEEPPLLFGEWALVELSNPSANATLDQFDIGIGVIVDDDQP